MSSRYSIALTNEILLEYREKLDSVFGARSYENILEAFIKDPDTDFIAPPFRHRLVPADPDDDKFVDCYLWANADYLVTNDKHFAPLKELSFPTINILGIEEFAELLGKE